MGTWREVCKRLRFVGACTLEPEGYRFSAQLKENGVSAGPDIVQHEAGPKESYNGSLRGDMRRNHRSAPASWYDRGVLFPGCEGGELSAA
jgi:hypothetical protein